MKWSITLREKKPSKSQGGRSTGREHEQMKIEAGPNEGN